MGVFSARKYVLIILILLCGSIVFGQYLNQHAFYSGASKNIFLNKQFGKKEYHVLNGQNAKVLSGKTTKPQTWKHSGTTVCIADVSKLTAPGQYTLKMKGLELNFTIRDQAYWEVGEKILKSFYHARVSVPILADYAGEYARAAGHPDDQVMIHSSAATPLRPEGFKINSPGGWYDAGDYNKYIVNSAITVYSLLHTYELFPDQLNSLNINIPESKNKTSDLLDETFYNLQWMLTMQDPDDGGVYHKLTSLTFCGFIMPDKDKLPRYVVAKSTAASLDFAATFAKAARVYKMLGKNYNELSKVYLSAAVRAYDWAVANPTVIFTNPPDVKTGAYDDVDIRDEWYWAAMELYLSTGNPQYVGNLNTDEQVFTVPEWRRTNMMGIYSFLAAGDQKGLLDMEKHKNKLLRIANNKYQKYLNAAFRIPIEVFPWGSNSEVANDGILLMYAYLYSGKQGYLDAADACANYLMGANPLGKCFITGFGNDYPKFPHDRRCSADGIADPIPGLMIGGPTKAVRTDCGEQKYASSFPAMSYLDLECSYSTNETAINWNSAGVALFLGLDIIHKNKKS